MKRRIAFGLVLILVAALAVFWPAAAPESPLAEPSPITLRIGTAAEAAGTADYTTDGTADDVQFQAALTALPATGGRIVVMGGTYNWTNAVTVSRAINNVTWEGAGTSTFINSDGVTAAISAGVQTGWVFRDIRFDTAGLSVTGSLVLENVTVGTAYTARTVNYTGIVDVAKSGATYTTIQAGVTYANSQTPTAAQRWLVRVHPGTYTEQTTMVQYVDVAGVDKGTVIVAVTGGQTAFTMAEDTVLSNLSITAAADAGGDAIAVNGNDTAFTVEGVNITLSRSANRGFGLYEVGNTARTILLRNLRIVGNPDNTSLRAIKVEDGGGGQNKTVLVYDSYMKTSVSSATVEVAGSGGTLEFYNSTILEGGVATTKGGYARGTVFDDFVMELGTAASWAIVDSHIDEFKNRSNQLANVWGTVARTVENTNAAAVTQWWTGEISIVESTTYPGPPPGSITWRQHDRMYRVLAKMSIQDAVTLIDSVEAPAPSATFPYTVVVDTDTWDENVVMAPYINIVGTDKLGTILVSSGGETTITGAVGANISNLTINAAADGGGNGVAISANDASFAIENVNINLTRSANAGWGIYENTGATARSIRLRNVRIVGTDANITGIYTNQANKSFVVEESHIETARYAIWLDATANIASKNNYYWASGSNDLALQGGTLTFDGDNVMGGSALNVQVAGGSATFRNTYVTNRLDNTGAGTITFLGGRAPTDVRTTSGPINISYPGGLEERHLYRAHNSALFNAAGLTDSEAIWAQPADSVLLGVRTELRTQFAAAGMTDLDVTVGDGGDNTGILNEAQNLTSDAVDTLYRDRGAYWSAATAAGYYSASGVTWTAYATAVGANLDTTSAGGVQFRVTYRQL